MDYGIAYTKGESFRARAERAQREFRAEWMGAGWRQWGHLLDECAMEEGANFLTESALRAAESRELKGKGVDHARTWGNMLSSQAMCFNIFGTVAASDVGRLALAKSLDLLGYPVKAVHSVEIEYTPDDSVFGDQSSSGGVDCDVLIRFASADASTGVLVIETKFVEPEFSRCGFRTKPEYRLDKATGRHVATDKCPEGTVAGCDGSGCRYQTKKGYRYWGRSFEHQTLENGVCAGACPFGDFKWQLWTNHTLAHVVRTDEGHTIAHYAVCAPKNNKALLDSGGQRFGKIEEFRSLLDVTESFSLLQVEDLIGALHDTVPSDFPERQQWLTGLDARYVIG